jgi:ribosomal protein S18 acetylase RimI-like enzyme
MDELTPEQRDAAAATLAEAFHEDPMGLVLAPDERRRPSLLRWMWRATLSYGMRWGHVWTNDDASAVATWLPPGSTKMTVPRMIRVGLWALPFRAGLRTTIRAMSSLSVTDQLHKAVEGPHWYLLALGTRRDRQGQGHGSRLVEEGTRRADAASLPCYLETATEPNVAYYTKRGFRVEAQAPMEGFTICGMVRPAATASISEGSD